MRQACGLRQSLPQKAVDQPTEARRGGVKGGADGVGSHLLQLAGDNGGEQGAVLIRSLTLGGIAVLPRALIDAFHASQKSLGQSRPDRR